jgi:hypothetical protein
MMQSTSFNSHDREFQETLMEVSWKTELRGVFSAGVASACADRLLHECKNTLRDRSVRSGGASALAESA